MTKDNNSKGIILIIVSSGIYIFMREKARNQSIATEKPLR